MVAPAMLTDARALKRTIIRTFLVLRNLNFSKESMLKWHTLQRENNDEEQAGLPYHYLVRD